MIERPSNPLEGTITNNLETPKVNNCATMEGSIVNSAHQRVGK